MFVDFPFRFLLLVALLSGTSGSLRAAVPDGASEGSQPGQGDTEVMEAEAGESRLRIPVEVVSKGSAPEWVYVEVENQAVPEPGALPLLLLPALVMLRRRRSQEG